MTSSRTDFCLTWRDGEQVRAAAVALLEARGGEGVGVEGGRGSKEAQFLVGVMLWKGEGFNRDHQQVSPAFPMGSVLLLEFSVYTKRRPEIDPLLVQIGARKTIVIIHLGGLVGPCMRSLVCAVSTFLEAPTTATNSCRWVTSTKVLESCGGASDI